MQEEPNATALDGTDVLWSYKLHEEMVLYQRLNFFVVAESMLFAAYATLLASSGKGARLMLAISVLGLLLGFISVYVNIRQAGIINAVSEVCKERFSDYAVLKKNRESALISSLFLLIYAVPISIIFVWLFALFTVDHSSI